MFENSPYIKRHIEWFSAPKSWIFELRLSKIGVFDYNKKPKYQKTAKNCFYRSLRKVESFPFFFTVFNVFYTNIIPLYLLWHVFQLTYSKSRCKVRLPKLGWATIPNIWNITKNQKMIFIGPLEKLKVFRFFLQFLKFWGTDLTPKIFVFWNAPISLVTVVGVSYSC